jgi:hypothetical protein
LSKEWYVNGWELGRKKVFNKKAFRRNRKMFSKIEFYLLKWVKFCSKNKIRALRMLAIPVLWYSFRVINGRLEEPQKIGRKTRGMLTM